MSTEFNRFVVQMVAGGYVSLEWTEGFNDDPEVTFVPDIADAYWFTDEDRAIDQALSLYPTSPMKVIPIHVTIGESDYTDMCGEIEALRLQVQARYSYYQGVIDAVDSLSAQNTEDLSEFKWLEYKAGKVFVKKYEIFVQEPL